MTQASDLKGITLCTSKAGLAAGSTSTYTTAATTSGMIGGKYVTALSAQTDTATPTTDYSGAAFTALGVSEGCVFVFSLVAAGTIAVHQSDVYALDASNAFKIAPQFPAIDLDTYMPFGYLVLKNGSTGSAWTFGASNWTATGAADTFTDVGVLPRRPQTA